MLIYISELSVRSILISTGELRRPFKHFTRSGKGRDSRVPPSDFSVAIKDLGIWVHHDFILYEILWFFMTLICSCIYLFKNMYIYLLVNMYIYLPVCYLLIIAGSSYLSASRFVPSRMIVPFTRRLKNILKRFYHLEIILLWISSTFALNRYEDFCRTGGSSVWDN